MKYLNTDLQNCLQRTTATLGLFVYQYLHLNEKSKPYLQIIIPAPKTIIHCRTRRIRRANITVCVLNIKGKKSYLDAQSVSNYYRILF